MADHPPGERVRPTDILECVKKHRFFPQAEASIRLRIPNVPKCIHLEKEVCLTCSNRKRSSCNQTKKFDLEQLLWNIQVLLSFLSDPQGPNPYAVMAMILLLSENVIDVEALVTLLSGCMSCIAIKEYLSHMAMMLLAIKRSNIKISDRWALLCTSAIMPLSPILALLFFLPKFSLSFLGCITTSTMFFIWWRTAPFLSTPLKAGDVPNSYRVKDWRRDLRKWRFSQIPKCGSVVFKRIYDLYLGTLSGCNMWWNSLPLTNFSCSLFCL